MPPTYKMERFRIKGPNMVNNEQINIKIFIIFTRNRKMISNSFLYLFSVLHFKETAYFKQKLNEQLINS